MTTCFLAPDPIQSTQFIPGGNTPANGGQLFFYTAGTSTKTTVYKDNAAAVSWTNPLVLDSGGNLPGGGEVWFPQGIAFKVIFSPSNDTDPPASPYWTKDNLTGINDITSGASGVQWITGPTPVFVGATAFSVTGDQTSVFDIGRRIFAVVAAGNVYGDVFSTAFAGGSTTVNTQMDSTNLDAGLSAVSYGVLSSLNTATPNLRSVSTVFQDSTNGTKRGSVSVSSVAVSTTANINWPVSSGTMARLEDLAYINTSAAQRLVLPLNFIEGFQIANSASSDAMDIGMGQCVDSTNSFNIVCTTAFNRKTNAAFAAGPSSGAKLSAAAISSNCWYAWYAMLGSSGAVDYGFDLEFPPGTPTTTAAFPGFRYIGGRKTMNSTTVWESFHQYGDRVYRDRSTSSDIVNLNNYGTAATTLTLYCPPVRVLAHMDVWVENFLGGSVNVVYISPLDVTDQAPGSQTNPYGSISCVGTNTTGITVAQVTCMTNGSSQVRARSNATDTNINLNYVTYAWTDPRGKIIS